ncbi:retrotransposon protein [Cucumis melo var. makuwa]|uniref:Retrotransposon protein n=1 Tax=Cucumis melo var. makuwa TaxID=1194695 RepID=A0A5D3CBD1_CUCMM|nr:retrotransposon protein [Cucumis melo var. makuwa]TYK07666.1 retrotransposon protein [Cucumis melo var. makuwa]
MAESIPMDAFATGLEPSLQAEVVSRYPHTLDACIGEAQLVNDRNLASKLAEVEWGNQGSGSVVTQPSKKDGRN